MPTLQKKVFYIRLLFGLGAIVGGIAVLALQVFVLHRINIFLSLGCAAAILGGLASPLLLKDWACAACGAAMDAETIHVAPMVASQLIPALGARNVQQMLDSVASAQPETEGNEVSLLTCGKCSRSVMLSAGPSKEIVFLERDAELLTPALKRLVVPDNNS